MGNSTSNDAAKKSLASQDEGKVVEIPKDLLDPLTHKIMLEPVMALASMKVYEQTTIDKWLESKRNYDPVTGIPMSVGPLPVLLRPREDIALRVSDFIEKYPQFKSKVFKKEKTDDNDVSDVDGINWKSLFESCDQRVKQIMEELIGDQTRLKTHAKQIFGARIPEDKKQNENDDNVEIVYNESVLLDPAIPIICFMGPSRNGKSTIVNDILGASACETSTKSNVAKTKGAWITLYDHKSDDAKMDIKQVEENKFDPGSQTNARPTSESKFYILDMEGLSHGVTKATKKLFYACYATSNVIVWNDKEVDSDRFQDLMNELKEEMTTVAQSDSKPRFVYLKRDCGDFEFDPFDTFDEYINKDKTFEYLRKMAIFESLSAYELERPKKIGKNPLSFGINDENKALLQPFIKKIVQISKGSTRFSSNMYLLKEQIRHINKSTGLSLTKRLIMNDKILELFVIPSASDDFHRRRRDMIYVATYFNWDAKLIKTEFEKSLAKLKESFKLDEKILQGLIETEQEIYQRVKNKTRLKGYGSTTVKFGSGGAAIGGVGVGAVTAAAIVMLGGGWAVAALGGAIYGTLGAAEGFVYGSAVGAVVESVQVATCYYKGDSYLKYALGRTQAEIDQDKEKAKHKTVFNEFVAWPWGSDA